MRKRILYALVAIATLLLGTATPAEAPVAVPASHGARVLSGQVPEAVADGRAHSLRPATRSSSIDIAVGLRMRDRPGLDEFLASASDPSSPNYGHHMSQAKANASFNPTAAAEGRVKGWLRSHGLRITGTYPNHLLVDARGTVAQVSGMLDVTINNYQTTVNGKQTRFYANADNPTIDASVSDTVQAVLGLDDYPQFNTFGNGTGHASAPYYPQDFADAYDVNPLWDGSYTGSGQHIGITLWTVPPSDTALSRFRNDTGASVATQANGRLNVVQVDGGTTTADDGEAAMDVEYSSGMAPGATIDYYEASAPTYSSMADALNAAGTATDANGNPLDRQITNSWGGCESSTAASAVDSVLASNSATGHNYFFSSGDDGSWCRATRCAGNDPWPVYPASSAYVTSVGGTRSRAAISGSYPGEDTWRYDPTGSTNDCTLGAAPEGSGGGYSRIFTRPSWQAGAGLAVDGMRGYPDISAAADPATGAYVVIDHNGSTAAYQSGAPAWRVLCGPE